jgi:glycolate oxidase FAD binding subunit
LAEIEAALRENNQQLAFEPPDLAPLYGAAAGAGTIGGALSCNLAGPRRIKAGAARDHFLGVRAVRGRGEAFKAGGRVVKNVTGYDLPKLLAGSYGTLAALTEVTIKVLPAPEKTRTVLVYGRDDAGAVEAMTLALNSPHEASAAAHLPAAVAVRSSVDLVAGAGRSVTAVRVEGPGPSVEARCAALRELLRADEELHSRRSATLWREIRDVAPLLPDPAAVVWRLSVPPASPPLPLWERGQGVRGEYFFDWGGGLVWLALPPADDAHAPAVRAAVARSGGHATLLRAPAAVRLSVPVFQPQPEPLAALSRRVKESFDPRRILNPGRLAPDL